MSYSSATKGPDAGSQATREELHRIITSPGFEDAERLVRFLTFVVEETLSGHGSLLKESVIGVEVFGRNPGYDPKTDPIVRVQARRLRAKLETWYEAGGQASTVRIALPKGGYTPEFGPPPKLEPIGVIPAVAPSAPPRRTAWLLFPIAGLLLLGTAAVILTLPKTKPTTPGSRLFTAYPGYQTSPAFSPDGLSLAFSWGGPDGDNVDIYVQPLDADNPRRLTTSPERERSPVWLPDGQHIGFLRDAGPDRFAVMVVPIQGAGERRVAEIRGNPAAPPRIEWSHDGKKIYTSESASPDAPLGIVEINLESGARRLLIPPVAQGSAAGTPGDDELSLSPDGKRLAFRRRTASVVGDVFVAPVSGGGLRAVTSDRTGVTGLAWTRDGQSLIVSSQRQSSLVRLWRFPINGQPPVCLTDAALAASYPAVSPRDGQIAFASRFFDTNIWRIDLHGDSPPQRLIASNLLDSSPRYSPDSQRIVFRSNRTGNDEIWTADVAGRSPVRLTSFGGPVTGSPRWSPDGQYLVFDSRPDGSADVFLIPAGGGRSRKLTAETSNEVTPSFSSDGKSIYFASDRTGTWQIWKQPKDGGVARQITAHGGFGPQESPDGQWLYYAKLDSNGLFRIPVNGGAETTVIASLPSGLWGGWGLAGRTVVYVTLPEAGGTGPAELRAFDLETGKTDTITSLRFPPAQWDGSVGLSPDGHYALVTELERQGSEIHLQPER
jgi:Tol biopolymer transport system component